MDRARRATPVSSPFTFLRDRRREQELHVRRLAHTRPSVDNSRPASLDLPHLARNAKGDAMRKERLARIEGENRVLLEVRSRAGPRPLPACRPCPGLTPAAATGLRAQAARAKRAAGRASTAAELERGRAAPGAGADHSR